MTDTKFENARLETIIEQKFADLNAKLDLEFSNLCRDINKDFESPGGPREGRDSKKAHSESFRIRYGGILYTNNTNRR
jgi:hypothetical protein